MSKADRDARRADLYTDSVDRDSLDSQQLPIQEWEYDNPNDLEPKMRPVSRKLESDYFYFSETPGEKEFRIRVDSDILYIEKWDSGGSSWEAYLTIDADGNVDLIGNLLVNGDLTTENLNVLSTTQSSSKDTGAVIIEGGVGIEKNLNVGGGVTVPVMHVQDQKAANVDGGSSSAGLNIRDLNTVLTNTITGASLNSNQITLPAGTYKIDATVVVYISDRHFLQLYNITDSLSAVESLNHYARSTANQGESVSFRDIFTISTTKIFEIRHYIQTAGVTNGLGIGSNTELGNAVERYTDVFIEKIG